jgi:hypothetical protein
VGLPLTRTEAVAVVTHSFIHFLHNTGNPILCITVTKYTQSTESNVFSKSNSNIISSFFHLQASSTTSLAIRTPSRISGQFSIPVKIRNESHNISLKLLPKIFNKTKIHTICGPGLLKLSQSQTAALTSSIEKSFTKHPPSA